MSGESPSARRSSISASRMPLTLTDLTGETYRHDRRERMTQGSFLLPEQSYREYAFQNTGDEDEHPAREA